MTLSKAPAGDAAGARRLPLPTPVLCSLLPLCLEPA